MLQHANTRGYMNTIIRERKLNDTTTIRLDEQTRSQLNYLNECGFNISKFLRNQITELYKKQVALSENK